MDLDNIIPIVVLIFWGLAALLGKGSKQKRKGEKKPSGGLLEKIQSAVEDIAEEINSSKTPDFNFDLLEDDVAVDKEIVVQKPVKSLPIKEKTTYVIPKSSSAKSSMELNSASKSKYSSEKLKEAIIWSEIIAPPLSLRD